MGLISLLFIVEVACRGHAPSTPPSAEVRAARCVQTGAGTFLLELLQPDDATEAQVAQALQRAAGPLEVWGRLPLPVHVEVLPSHEALEDAVHRPGYAWLRAWSRYDVVYLQSPATWGLFGAPQSMVDEVMLHELTHALLFQETGSRADWTKKEIPLWFREGMATFTAGQGHRWPSLEELSQYMGRHPGTDLVQDAEAHYRDDSDEVYGAAHHAFTFLIRRYGQDKVLALMRAMSQGDTFPAAFERAYGLSARRFTADFDHYLRWHGFER